MIKITFIILGIISLIAIAGIISISSPAFSLKSTSQISSNTPDIQSILSAIQNGQLGQQNSPSTGLDIASILSTMRNSPSTSTTDIQSKKPSTSTTDDLQNSPSTSTTDIQSILSFLKNNQLPAS